MDTTAKLFNQVIIKKTSKQIVHNLITILKNKTNFILFYIYFVNLLRNNKSQLRVKYIQALIIQNQLIC